jgi:hypothetical protein
VKWTLRRIPILPVAVSLAAALGAPAWAADDDQTLTEIVNVLREQGLIDEDEHTELAAKAAKRDAKQAWTDRVNVWGDFRARYEGFLYEQDIYTRANGDRLQDRHRGRYRGRLNVSGEVVSRATVYLRLSSGNEDPRSTNQTFGGGDFDTDDVRFDLAYVTLTPFEDGEVPGIENGFLGVNVGKTVNPFLWKELGMDALLWDGDITPEGVTLRSSGDFGPLSLFTNGGFFVMDENGSAKDPSLVGGQLGGTLDLAEYVSFGARGSIYHFFSLDDDFYARAEMSTGTGGTGGNLIDGLGRADQSIQVAEGSAFIAVTASELFPVLLFGSYANNLSARPSLVFPTEGREDDAWTAGIYVGDEKQLVQLGFGFIHIEANAFPSMFLDSDLLDGTPNREGWFAELERELLDGVTVKLTGYSSKRIEGGVAHANSGPASDRLRGRADMIFKF